MSVGFLLTAAWAHTLGRAHRLASPSTSCTRSPLTRDPMLHATSSCSWPLLLGRSRSSPSLPTSSGPHPPPLIPPPSRTVTPPLLCYCATIKNATGDLVDPPGTRSFTISLRPRPPCPPLGLLSTLAGWSLPKPHRYAAASPFSFLASLTDPHCSLPLYSSCRTVITTAEHHRTEPSSPPNRCATTQ
jgi:hypothetical protein